MQEKSYKTVKKVGGCSIAIGIITLIAGVVCGILTIVNGAKLLKSKSDMLFWFIWKSIKK